MDSYVQLPTDGGGKKLRTRQRVVGTETVEEQYVVLSGVPTFLIWTGALAMAGGKYFLAMLNAAGSGQLVKLRKLFFVNARISTVTGVMAEFQVRRITGFALGTAIVPQAMDTADTLTGLTVVHTPTVLATEEGALLFPWYTNTDEIGTGNTFMAAQLQALGNVVPEGPEVKELTLRPGERVGVKQQTSTTAGTYGVLAVVTVEPV